ncbi:MAG TPA: serine/threonine-protein kinase, partial [Thermopolyspora sp.]
MDLPDTVKGGLGEGDVLIRRYHLRERIAEGGMSVIWRAFDQSLQRMVAVKVLDGSFDGDHGGRELIRREARAAARLRHPDVIEVYDYGETITSQGRVAAFVVMRLLDGRPLAERLLEGPLPWEEAAGIGLRLALVLSAAHTQGIVHRDVTPENVLLTDDGAKLLDFGIAAIEDDHGNERLADFGTPPYVAPERLKGVTADPAIDIYALGVLLFQMITGNLPYPEYTWEAIETVRRIGPPPEPVAPGLPPEVATLCRRCLSQEPEQRPSAQHLAEVLARSVTSSRRTSRVRRRWMMVSVAVAAACAIGLTWSNSMVPMARTVDASGLWPTSTAPASAAPTEIAAPTTEPTTMST